MPWCCCPSRGSFSPVLLWLSSSSGASPTTYASAHPPLFCRTLVTFSDFTLPAPVSLHPISPIPASSWQTSPFTRNCAVLQLSLSLRHFAFFPLSFQLRPFLASPPPLTPLSLHPRYYGQHLITGAVCLLDLCDSGVILAYSDVRLLISRTSDTALLDCVIPDGTTYTLLLMFLQLTKDYAASRHFLQSQTG